MTVECLLLYHNLKGKEKSEANQEKTRVNVGREEKEQRKDESGHCGWRRVGEKLRHKKEKNKIKLNYVELH